MLLIAGDIGDEKFCRDAVKRACRELGRARHSREQRSRAASAGEHRRRSRRSSSSEPFARTFSRCSSSPKRRCRHLKKGSSIINTTSVTAYKGSPELLDYSSTKGAIVAFTRSLSQALAEQENSRERGRTGPDLDAADSVDLSGERGGDIRFRRRPLKRPAQPDEVATLLRVSSPRKIPSYMTGQILHPNGGTSRERMMSRASEWHFALRAMFVFALESRACNAAMAGRRIKFARSLSNSGSRRMPAVLFSSRWETPA